MTGFFDYFKMLPIILLLPTFLAKLRCWAYLGFSFLVGGVGASEYFHRDLGVWVRGGCKLDRVSPSAAPCSQLSCVLAEEGAFI